MFNAPTAFVFTMFCRAEREAVMGLFNKDRAMRGSQELRRKPNEFERFGQWAALTLRSLTKSGGCE